MANKRVTAWKNFIPESIANQAIAKWHDDHPSDRVQVCASPSTLLECPRVVWLKKQGVEPTNTMGWGKKQRLLLGRILENQIADQFKHSGILLWHWKDDVAGESVKFEHGDGLDKIAGTGDLLLQLGKEVGMSDAKTSRSDSFLYVPTDDKEIFQDYFWRKHKLQVTAYFMLAHWNKEWFVEMGLPLPTVGHLFSYALDDGIVRRDITWKPSKEDAEEVMRLTRRWNAAYNADEMPACTCQHDEGKGVLFCPYGIQPSDKNFCTSCCDDGLWERHVEKTADEFYEKEEIN